MNNPATTGRRRRAIPHAFVAPTRRYTTRLLHLASTAACAAFALLSPNARAQAPATGVIEGRVQNVVTGDYLNNARVSIAGTSNVTFTDEAGYFYLAGVPAGSAKLRVFFSGLDEQEISVNVTAGQTLRQDFKLTSKSRYGDTADVVQLNEFVVQSTKETNAAAIATNEQRFSPNIKSVVSTDEFGTIVDKNPGEFLKWLPGVDVEYFANNIVGVSVRGLGSVNTEINFDGMPTASANAETVGRGFEVQYASAADISRVEIRKLPLPEDSANALGGSINLVRRSAFEYSKRKVSYTALFTSDGEKLTLGKIDGPKDHLRDRWRPNWSLNWTEPVNENLGFAFTIGQNNVISNTHWSLPGWNLGSSSNNAAAEAAIAAGQPYTKPSLYTPAIRNPLNHNAPLMQGKDYASVRVDWRPSSTLTLGYSLSGTNGWKQVADDIRYRWDGAASGSGDVATYTDENMTIGRTGGGAIYHDNPLWRDIKTPTITNSIEATWRSGEWTVSARGVLSYSTYEYFDTSHGFFNSTSVPNVSGLANVGNTGVGSGTANPVPLTITFKDQDYWGPKTIDAVASSNYTAGGNSYTAGQPVEWWKNSTIRIGGARSRPGKGEDIITAAKIFVKRDFSLENPVSLQLGFDYSEEFKDRRYPYYTWRFVGADGVASSPDDSATLIAADHLQARRDSRYDYPAIERISMTKLYQLYKDHPTWFQYDEARSARLSLTSNPAYELTETNIAPYLQFDWRLFRDRLRLTGGVRYERSDAKAKGLLINNTAAYQKYSDGTVKRAGDVVDSSTGLPTTRAGAPVYLPGVTTGSLAETSLVYTEKGAYAEGSNDNFFPSLHSTFNITSNLILQVGYARTQAKNRYDRTVIPQNEILDTIQGNGALGRINLRNPDLKPWVADNLDARLSYYTTSGGMIGLGLYRKNIDNYQVSLTTDPLSESELAQWGFGPEYAGYDINTMFNAGKARIDGAELELSQSIDRFVPDWARGFHVRASVAYTNLKGQPAGGDFNGLRDWRDTLSIGYRHGRFSITAGYIMNGKNVSNGRITSNGHVGEEYNVPQNLVDFNAEYSITKWARVFIAGSNITDELRAREQAYDGRPLSRSMSSSNTLGVTYTVGVSGTF